MTSGSEANPAVVRAQPDRDADLEATDGDLGGTAPHVAATVASDPDAVAALLEAGADIEAIDDEGRTACGIARMTRRDEATLRLLCRRPRASAGFPGQ